MLIKYWNANAACLCGFQRAVTRDEIILGVNTGNAAGESLGGMIYFHRAPDDCESHLTITGQTSTISNTGHHYTNVIGGIWKSTGSYDRASIIGMANSAIHLSRRIGG